MDDSVAVVTEAALDRALDFGRRWGRGHLLLAAHAAFPPLLTPDLLYAIWRAFAEPTTPWTAVSDVLLSGLCREVSVELYALDPPVREALLDYLAHDRSAGPERLTALAGFLRAYARDQHHAADPDVRALAEAQDWTGLVYLDPHEAARLLATAFATRDPADTARLARLTELVELLRVPLAAVAPDLLPYARGLTAATLGDWSTAATAFATLAPSAGQIAVAGVGLAVPQIDQRTRIADLFVQIDKAISMESLSEAHEYLQEVRHLTENTPAMFQRERDSAIARLSELENQISRNLLLERLKGQLRDPINELSTLDTRIAEAQEFLISNGGDAELEKLIDEAQRYHANILTNLSNSQLEELHTLLRAAFPTRPALARMVRFELGQQLDVLTTSSNLSDTVFELIQWVQANGRLADLLQAAVAANPDHTGLRAFVAGLNSAPADPGPNATNLTWKERRNLYNLLIATYTTEDQVRDLCRYFGIVYRQLDGEDLPDRLASLIDTAQQRGQAADLAAAAREEADQQWEEAAQRSLGPIVSIAFAPDGAVFATGSGDGTVQLWRVADGGLLQTFTGHTAGVNSVAFAPNGQTLASGSWDQYVKLWRISDGSLLHTFPHYQSRGVTSVAFSRDGQLLASGSSASHGVNLWLVADGKESHGFTPYYTDRVNSVAFAPDGQILAAGSGEPKELAYNNVYLLRVDDGSLKHKLIGHTSAVNSVAFAPDGQIVASGAADKTVCLWRVADGSLLQTLTGHTAGVKSVAFAPDGQILASGSLDGTVRLWRVADGTLWHQLGKLSDEYVTGNKSNARLKDMK